MENNDNRSSIAEVQSRIFQIISTMPEAQKRRLLTGLEKWQSKFDDKQQSKIKDKRKYSRKPISFGEDFFMTLVHNSFETPVRTSGKITRVDPKGVGVKFNETIPRMYFV